VKTTNLDDIEFINKSVIQLSSRLESMDEILKSNQNLIEYRLMMDLLQNKATTKDGFFDSLNMIDKSPLCKKYNVMILELLFPSGNDNSTLHKYEYLRIKLQNLISNEYSQHILLNIVYSAHSIVILLNTDQKETLTLISNGLYNLIDSSIKLPFNLALSKSYEDILLTHNYYESAEKMLRYSFLLGYKNIFTDEILSNHERNDYIISTETMQKIEAKLRSAKIDDLKNMITELSNKMRSGYSIGSVLNSLNRISNIITVYLQDSAINFPAEKIESLKKYLYLAKNIDDYINAIFDILDDFSQTNKADDNYFYDALIKEITEYIECNLQNDLSLSSLASNFNLSQGHLSKLFKKHTGYSFSKYVIDKKMEKAAILIMRENYKIKEISESLGYFKMSYFSKVFKEKYGVTPVEFRKKNTWM
jgi:YesN/AraC family two-component response regulator